MSSINCRFRVALLAVLQATAALRLEAQSSGTGSYTETLRKLQGAPVDVDSLYREAVARRVALDAQIAKAGTPLFGRSLSTIEILRRMRTDSAFVMHDADSIVNAYASGLLCARALLPRMIDDVTDGPIEVVAIPESLAAGSPPAGYHRPHTGSSGDTAQFYVNAHQPGGIARMNILLGVAHEAYPGHHLQTMYALRRGTFAEATALNGAFIEGWGIYAEQLGDEIGLYDGDAVARLGYLVHLFDVFMALQVDLGMHARGWDRAAAIDTMMVVAGRPRSQAETYASRHAATPGQLASYGIGLTALVRMRERAAAALGSRFELKRFHAVVLADGGITLPVLEQRVTDWILREAQ